MKLYATSGTLQVIMPRSFCGLFNRYVRKLSAHQAMNFLENSSQPIRLFKSYELARMHSINLAANKADHFDDELHPDRHNYYVTPIFTVEVDDTFFAKNTQHETVAWRSDLELKAAARHNIKISSCLQVEYSYANLSDINRVIRVQLPHHNFKNRLIPIDKLLLNNENLRALATK